MLTTLSELACVPRSLVFGALPDTGSPRVPGRAPITSHGPRMCTPPASLPKYSEDRSLNGCCRAQDGERDSSTTVKKRCWIFRSVDFSAVYFLSSSSCYWSETDLNMSLIYQLHFKKF